MYVLCCYGHHYNVSNVRPEFFLLVGLWDVFFSDLGSGEREKKALKMTSKLAIFRGFFFQSFFLISPE